MTYSDVIKQELSLKSVTLSPTRDTVCFFTYSRSATATSKTYRAELKEWGSIEITETYQGALLNSKDAYILEQRLNVAYAYNKER